MNYIITGTTYNSKYASAPDAGIRVLSAEELAASDIRFTASDKIYVPSETSLSLVIERSKNPDIVTGIHSLKDKYLCRKALSKLYPDFYFDKCGLNDISKLKINDKKIVIKPQKGFFGTGVRFAEAGADLEALSREISMEVAEYSRFFPKSILSVNEYIVEEYISGEEYAVDMYFDELGQAVIMNIYHHPAPLNDDYAHLMYYSDASLFAKYLDTFTRFFNDFGAQLELKNFPIHAEFKLQGQDFIPIEFNPMRYGGFGLADLGFHSYGIHPIAAYFAGNTLDWNDIWQTRQEYSYAFILAYNPKQLSPQHKPNHERFRKHLQQHVEIMDYIKLDHSSNPVFAIAYIKSQDPSRMMSLLETEFADFFD